MALSGDSKTTIATTHSCSPEETKIVEPLNVILLPPDSAIQTHHQPENSKTTIATTHSCSPEETKIVEPLNVILLPSDSAIQTHHQPENSKTAIATTHSCSAEETKIVEPLNVILLPSDSAIQTHHQPENSEGYGFESQVGPNVVSLVNEYLASVRDVLSDRIGPKAGGPVF
ncbi:hypothetical protein Bbelb_148890 [Branchiostoma belcheri]|nr:hypothetical protein Bbelb_148890 [Branchiostoma belcheri]